MEFERVAVAGKPPPDSAYVIFQDNQGFIWFGADDGLYRYDGQTFEKFVLEADDPVAPASNLVNSIRPSRSGDLWVAFERRGLARYDRETGKLLRSEPVINSQPALTTRLVSVALEDRQGNLWVGTWDQGLFRLAAGERRCDHFPLASPRQAVRGEYGISVLFEDRRGGIWVGTWADGLFHFTSGSEIPVHYRNVTGDRTSLSNDSITAVTEDQDGIIWIGTGGGGVNRLVSTPSGVSFFRYLKEPNNPNSLSNNDVRCLCFDRQGSLWIGTFGGGLNVLDVRKNQFNHYLTNRENVQSLSSNMVAAIIQDRSGLIWIGTWDGGLNTIDPRKTKFTLIQNDPENPDSLSINEIRAIYEDSAGTLWIGTWGGGLNRWERSTKKFSHFLPDADESPSLRNNAVTAICEDHRGVFWVATATGKLCRFDRRTGRFNIQQWNKPCTESNYISFIHEDRSGSLWIGTSNCGLIKLDTLRKSSANFRHQPSDLFTLPDDAIVHIYQDPSGLIWIATLKGLIRFDPVSEKFVPWDHAAAVPAELKKELVYFFKEDRSSAKLWIGAVSGLYVYSLSSKTFSNVSRTFNLPPMTVCGIEQDDQGNLWLASYNGLMRFDLAQKKFKMYTVLDGLQGNIFRPRANFRSRDGEMFFGGYNGLNRFRPEQMQDNPFVPPMVLTAVIDRSGPVNLGTDVSGLRELTISQSRLPVTLTFAALCFTDPARNQYAYQLEKRDREWRYLGNRHQVTLDHLKIGNDRLRLRGSNADGVWNEPGIVINLIVTRPFWKNGWFLAGLSLLFLAALFFVIQRWIVKRHPALTRPVAPEVLASFCSRYDISKREQEIIELVIRGKSNQQIEGILFISLRTVKNHLYNIYQKAGIKSRLQLLYKIQRWQA